MINKVLSILASLFLVGCGGSGGSKVAVGKGTYVDSAVNGVKYDCGTQHGITGDTGVDGGFKYDVGQKCKFSIAGIELSKIDGDKFQIDGVEVKVGDVDVARFLQSLDDDGDASNGITITSKIKEVLEEKYNKTSIPKTDVELEDIATELRSASIGYSGRAKTKEEAELHMAGFSLELTADKVEILQGDAITFGANVKGDTQGIKYEWVDLDKTTQTITIDNLAVGEHVIVVKAIKNGITLVDSIKVKVNPSSDFLVSIKSNSNKYTTADDITLEANITGDVGDNLEYVWKDGENNLGVNAKTLIKKFTTGSHTVTVEVTGNGMTKDASFTFDVADVSDFNISNLTITQNSKNLMWVNAPKGTVDKNGNVVCLAIHGDEYNESKGYDDSFARAKTFCSQMDFAGFTNWRTPTVNELSNFIKDTNASNIATNYDRPCTQLLALVNESADPTDGADYRAVTTRFMSTKYFPNIGTVRDHTYAADVEKDKKYNVGLRCVRNIDGSGGQDVPSANITLSISGVKAHYDVSETVNLTANVTGATPTSYLWKENDEVLGSSKTLSKSDFAKGSHTVTVTITTNEVDKNKSVTFEVSDLSDFNITSLTLNSDEVIIQKSTNLMWVNEHNTSKGKCAKIHGNDQNHTDRFETEFTSAKGFCASIDGFAGKNGWRTPTSSELKNFIESTISAGILPAYDAHCAKLLALTSRNADTDNNNSYVTVTTRYNVGGAGIISNPGDLIPNIGLRCVRDAQ